MSGHAAGAASALAVSEGAPAWLSRLSDEQVAHADRLHRECLVGDVLGLSRLLLEEPEMCAAMPLCRRWRNRRPDFFGAAGDVHTQPVGLASVEHAPMLTRGIVHQDFPDRTIRKVLGENWLRVYQQV